MRRKRCGCGKLICFDSKDEAISFILSPHGTEIGVVRSYHCEVGNTYHVTRKKSYYADSIESLEVELHRDMATVKEMVVQYVRDKYRTSQGTEYKCSVSEVREVLTAKPSFTYTESSISVAVSTLTREGVVTKLDERAKVNGRRGGMPSYLFTLTEILEEVTKPQPATINQKKEETVSVPTQPKKPNPVTVAANPFDKVNSQLGEILTKLNGLVNGYSEIVKRPSNTDNSEVMDLLRVIADEMRNNNSATPVRIADAVNDRLQDLGIENSFIYRMREEICEATDREARWVVENIAIPEGVSNSDDYRAGIKEGIKLAAELGISLKVTEE
jgi:hypothetical protein